MTARTLVHTPLKDAIIDHTWRVNGKNVVRCPACGAKGMVKRTPAGLPLVVHKELLSDIRGSCIIDACALTSEPLIRLLERRIARHQRRQKPAPQD